MRSPTKGNATGPRLPRRSNSTASIQASLTRRRFRGEKRMSKEVVVPDIGDFTDVPVIEVLVKAGDTVAKEDPLVTLESDKATMEVPAPAGGVGKEVKVKVGDKVAEGALILTLQTAAAAAPQASSPQPAQAAAPAGSATPSAESAAPPPAAAPATVPGRAATAAADETAHVLAHASPSVRRF